MSKNWNDLTRLISATAINEAYNESKEQIAQFENSKELDQTIMAFENDEEKLIMELQKQDFLIKKEKIIQKGGNLNQYKFRFKKKILI